MEDEINFIQDLNQWSTLDSQAETVNMSVLVVMKKIQTLELKDLLYSILTRSSVSFYSYQVNGKSSDLFW